jgi:hypothetical protein
MAVVADSQHLPAVVIALPAEIDMANAGRVAAELGSAFAPGVRTVIADMTATRFCDSELRAGGAVRRRAARLDAGEDG